MANRAFIRFRNITIPNYSEVSDVFARFTAFFDMSDTPVNLRCAFVNEDNPDAPISYVELQAFSLTDWVSWNTLGGWTDGTTYDTPDLTDIFQTIIERSGWSSGNNAILIIEDVSSSGQRGFSSVQFDGGLERATLFVNYLARGGEEENIGSAIYEGETNVSSQYGRFLARTSNGDLHCTYIRRVVVTGGYDYWLCYAKSINGGETWTETILLYEESCYSFSSKIAIDDNDYIHIVWSGNISGGSVNQIRYIKYTTSWSAIENLTNSSSDQYDPSIAVDSNNDIHVVWSGKVGPQYRQIQYIKYTTSWGGITEITDVAPSQQYNPSIAIDNNDYIHIAWSGFVPEMVEQIRYIKYTTSWSAIENLTSEGLTQGRAVSIAIDSTNNVHIVWQGKYDGGTHYQIRYIKYTDSWSAIENLTNEYFQYSPNIAIDGNNYLHVIWSGGHSGSTDTHQIRYRKYVSSWEGIQNITSFSDHQTYPSFLWAMCPTIGGLKTNRTQDGFVFVWFSYDGSDYSLRYYISGDLTWET